MSKFLINTKRLFSEYFSECFLIFITAIIFCCWTLHPSNYFIFDDYQWQWFTQSRHPSEYLSVFPNYPYNDRPIGILVLKLLFAFFKMNSFWHHIILLLIHSCNSVLCYFVLKQFLKITGEEQLGVNFSKSFPFIASLFFAGWSLSTLRVVSWDSAVFDLTACLLSLLSILFYFKARDKHEVIYSILTLFFYFLALRAKEITIVLPIIFATIETYKLLPCNQHLIKQVGKNRLLLSMLLLMVLYLGRIYWVRSLFSGIKNMNSPYYLSFSPKGLSENLLHYLALYYNPFQEENFFDIFSTGNMLIYLFFAICLLLALLKKFPAARLISIALVLFIIQIAPVLPMKNMQQRLYLYLPSVFLSIISGAIICRLLEYTNFNKITQKALALLVSFILLIYVFFMGSAPLTRNFYLEIGKQNKKLFKSLQLIKPPKAGDVVYIINVPTNLAPLILFSSGSGGGDVLKSLYNDPTLSSKVVLKAEESNLLTHNFSKCIWDYNNGCLKTISN